MMDLQALEDDEVIALIEMARGYNRELLVEVLGFSHGSAGLPFLQSLLDVHGRGSAHLRVTALRALGRRLGPAAVPPLAAALTGGNLRTQLAALWSLQRVDDGAAGDQIIGWLNHRLRARGRANSWGLYEVSGILRYAITVGALPQLLEVLDRNLERLQPEERRLLDEAWPPDRRGRFRQSADRADGPDPAAVEAWYRMTAVEISEGAQLASLLEHVEPVITRLRKRRGERG